MSEAVAVVVLGAVLGGVAQVVSAWQDRRREGRAAALVIFDALSEALGKMHEPQHHPTRPVVVDFQAYAGIWEVERKALAHTMRPEKYAAISEAFADLRTLKRQEALALDLGDEVFDALPEAGTRCEKARRIAWQHAQSARAKARQRLMGWRESFKTWRGHRAVGRSVREVKKKREAEKER